MVQPLRKSLKSAVGRARSTAPGTWLCAMLIAPMGLAVRIPVYFAGADLDSTLAPFDSTQVAPDTTATPAPAGEIETTPGELRATLSGPERITKFTLAGGGGRYYREFRLGSECAAADPTILKAGIRRRRREKSITSSATVGTSVFAAASCTKKSKSWRTRIRPPANSTTPAR